MAKKFLLKKTTVLAVSAVALLGLSAAGSTRAAITATTNQAIVADIATANVAVSLLENDEPVADEAALLSRFAGEDAETFHIGKSYAEKVAFVNGESYDAYARVIITKSWTDDGRKDQTLNPELIHFDVADGSAWILDEAASTAERKVYYYKKMVGVGETVAVTDTLTVDNVLTELVTKSPVEGATGVIETTYDYSGKALDIEVRVDEIQTHNAKAAALASWGVYLSFDEAGNLTGVSHEAEVATNED